MFRFFIFSILIHGFFYFLIQLSLSPSIIEDPIVLVSYFEPSQTSPQLEKRKSEVKTKENPLPNENQKTIQEQSQQSALAQASQSSATTEQAFDSQTVSEKPRVLYQEKIIYPETAKSARVEGPVKLSVTIDKFGDVIDVVVIEGPGFGLNETAVQAMKNFKFSPAKKDGQSVAVRITYIYRFKLESR